MSKKTVTDGTAKGWQRATFIVREDTLKELKELAQSEDKALKMVVDEAFTLYLSYRLLDEDEEIEEIEMGLAEVVQEWEVPESPALITTSTEDLLDTEVTGMKEVVNIKIYEAKEVAEMLGITLQTVRTYIKNGRIKGQKVGNRWVVTEDSIKDFLRGV